MKIGELSTQTGASIDTIRFYERRGVLPTPARRPSGYREYPETLVERVLLVRRLQSVGLTLDEIVEFLAAHDQGGATCETQRWRLDAAQRRIRERIDELVAVENAIIHARADCVDGHCSLTA
jgi:DNA-binding transcriptional MerR regulator